jgi:transposase
MRETVELTRRTEASGHEVAQEIGIAQSVLNHWVREAQPSFEKSFHGEGSPRDEELARHKRELARVTKKRDFLRDAAVDSTGQRNTPFNNFFLRFKFQSFSRPTI